MSMVMEADPAVGPVSAQVPAGKGGAAPHGAELVIEPSGRVPRLAFGELWAYRTLLFFLVWRDLKVRYTQTVLGVGWAVVQPLLNTVVFTLIFGRLVHVPTDGVPYPVFALAAIVPWTYVSTAFASSGQSLLNSSNLITKVYFPRLVIPWAPVCSAAVDFAIGAVLLGGALVAYGQMPSVQALVVVPASVVAFALTAAGVGCWVSALSIQYRDVKHLIPFTSTVWMYLSPVVYPVSRIPEQYHLWYGLNPLAGTLAAFRASLVGQAIDWTLWLESFGVALVVFVSGTLYFRRTERVFADVV